MSLKIKQKKTWKKTTLLLLFVMSWGWSFAQLGMSASFGYGKIIPSHSEYPDTKQSSNLASVAAIWQTTGNVFRWSEHYNFPQIKLNFHYHWLGNSEVLGSAFGILPSMSFYTKKGRNSGLKFEIGAGLAFLSKPYHVVSNRENIVYGSNFNLSFALGLAYEWHLKKDFRVAVFAKIPHYSAGGLSKPNIGVNAFVLGTTVSFLRRGAIKTQDAEASELPVLNKKIRPFLRVSYGLSRTGLNGPKYPSYVAGAGVSKLLNRYTRINSGFEFIFNTSTYKFMKHSYGFPGEEFKQASRYSWYLGYELLFGHVGFLTEAGIYLNQHYSRQSIFTTKLGFNFYPRNTISHSKFLPFFGAYVRAYAGEADFFETTFGFMF